MCSELRARLPCLQEVWQATIGEELDCWRELNNRLQRILLAYVFDTASITFVCTRSTLAFVLSNLVGLFRSRSLGVR